MLCIWHYRDPPCAVYLIPTAGTLCSIGWNTLFQGLEHVVPWAGTCCPDILKRKGRVAKLQTFLSPSPRQGASPPRFWRESDGSCQVQTTGNAAENRPTLRCRQSHPPMQTGKATAIPVVKLSRLRPRTLYLLGCSRYWLDENTGGSRK